MTTDPVKRRSEAAYSRVTLSTTWRKVPWHANGYRRYMGRWLRSRRRRWSYREQFGQFSLLGVLPAVLSRASRPSFRVSGPPDAAILPRSAFENGPVVCPSFAMCQTCSTGGGGGAGRAAGAWPPGSGHAAHLHAHPGPHAQAHRLSRRAARLVEAFGGLVAQVIVERAGQARARSARPAPFSTAGRQRDVLDVKLREGRSRRTGDGAGKCASASSLPRSPRVRRHVEDRDAASRGRDDRG